MSLFKVNKRQLYSCSILFLIKLFRNFGTSTLFVEITVCAASDLDLGLAYYNNNSVWPHLSLQQRFSWCRWNGVGKMPIGFLLPGIQFLARYAAVFVIYP